MFSISNKTLHFLLHQSVRIKVAIHHVQTKKNFFHQTYRQEFLFKCLILLVRALLGGKIY